METFPIRPGLDLYWGESSSAIPAFREAHLSPLVNPDRATALFAFVLHGDDRRVADGMHLLHANAQPSSELPESLRANAPTAFPFAGCAFYATLAVTHAALQELLLGDDSEGATRVRAFADDPVAPAVALPFTPAARLAVESIRRCPFAGALRAMAFTARSHDLLLEFLRALPGAAPTPPIPSRNLQDQIGAAAAFLAEHLEEPPTLAALARRMGLSETSLKRGFHQVHGTTVFGYLRTRRMERAHALLQAGEATVLEAAALVGYSNPSNFAAAFRRQFGVNPKAFQLAARR